MFLVRQFVHTIVQTDVIEVFKYFLIGVITMEIQSEEDQRLNWRELHSGYLSKEEILEAVNDEDWQVFRIDLKGETTREKFLRLRYYVRSHPGRKAEVQVTNYINALARGGIIEPCR